MSCHATSKLYMYTSHSTRLYNTQSMILLVSCRLLTVIHRSVSCRASSVKNSSSSSSRNFTSHWTSSTSSVAMMTAVVSSASAIYNRAGTHRHYTLFTFLPGRLGRNNTRCISGIGIDRKMHNTLGVFNWHGCWGIKWIEEMLRNLFEIVLESWAVSCWQEQSRAKSPMYPWSPSSTSVVKKESK